MKSDDEKRAADMFYAQFQNHTKDTNDRISTLFDTIRDMSNTITILSERSNTFLKIQDQHSVVQIKFSEQLKRLTQQMGHLTMQVKEARTISENNASEARELRQMIHKLALLASKYKTEHATLKDDLNNTADKIRKMSIRVEKAETKIQTSLTTLKTLKQVGSTFIVIVTLIATLLGIYVTLFGPIAKSATTSG